jgi:hypothetical protein
MAGSREIPIRNLPADLTRQVHDKVRLHSAAMVLIFSGGETPTCCSGTFAQLNGEAGIVTARHVWATMRRSESVTLLVGGKPYYMRPQILRAFGPDHEHTLPEFDSSVPDIVFVWIPSAARRDIEAYGKVFYSVDLRRGTRGFGRFSQRGFWILAGTPQVLFGAETSMVPSLLYDTTVDRCIAVGDWDYLFVNLNIEKNPLSPRTYGGVSGGGIWRAAFKMSADGRTFSIQSPSRDIVLSGLAFFQTGEEGRQIIGHGPKSLYQSLGAHWTEVP